MKRVAPDWVWGANFGARSMVPEIAAEGAWVLPGAVADVTVLDGAVGGLCGGALIEFGAVPLPGASKASATAAMVCESKLPAVGAFPLSAMPLCAPAEAAALCARAAFASAVFPEYSYDSARSCHSPSVPPCVARRFANLRVTSSSEPALAVGCPLIA